MTRGLITYFKKREMAVGSVLCFQLTFFPLAELDLLVNTRASSAPSVRIFICLLNESSDMFRLKERVSRVGGTRFENISGMVDSQTRKRERERELVFVDDGRASIVKACRWANISGAKYQQNVVLWMRIVTTCTNELRIHFFFFVATKCRSCHVTTASLFLPTRHCLFCGIDVKWGAQQLEPLSSSLFINIYFFICFILLGI